MRSSMIRLVAVIATVALLLAVNAPAAHAGETEVDRKRRARAFVEEGNRKYDLGKYDGAISLYEQAYEIWPHPETLFNLCQAHRQKKDLEKAVFYCKSYLRNDDVSNDRRETVEARIAEMEKAVADARATAEKPPKDVDKPEPTTRPEAAAPAAVPAPPPSSTDAGAAPDAWYRDPLGWTLVGSGVILLGSGAGLVASANGLRDDGDRALTPERQVELYDQADSRETLGWVAGGVGAAALVVGVVKLVLHERPGDEAQTTSWTIQPARSGFGVVWGGSF